MADHVTAGEVYNTVKDWGLLTKDEWFFLHDLAVCPDGYAVELGTFRGMGTAAICCAFHDHFVLSIDNYIMQHHGESSLELAKANLASLGYCPSLLQCDSRVRPGWVAPNTIGFLFIDTDHRDVVLKAELEAWLPYATEDVIVVLHDYTPRYLTMIPFINEYFKDWERIGLVNWLIAFRRKI